jgi:AcrR family transcriptional regulator
MDPDERQKAPYHHGDLRAALLTAAEAELAEQGIEAFSLRQVARRAGVSHAAPAHHFGDANGLLTALAAYGFAEFLAMQMEVTRQATTTPQDKLIAAGVGYVEFARARPTLFRLMFGSKRTDHREPALKSAADAAFDHIVTLVRDAGGDGVQDVVAVWSSAHGLADLMISDRLKVTAGWSGNAMKEMIAGIIARNLPSGE